MKHQSLHQKVGRIISLRTFAILALFCPSLSWAVTYNFEGLSPGNLVGQDNWTLAGGGSSFIVQPGAGFDTSLVVRNPGAGGANFNVRQNNGGFSFGSISSSETAAVLQFDTRVNYPTPGENQNFSFWLADVNGNISASPQIQYGNGSGTPIFALRQAQFTPAGASAAVPASVLSGDWVRVMVTMNFTANGGDGFGNVSFADLTQGTPFAPVAGLQNVPLGMSVAGVTPSAWNSLWIRSDLAAPGLVADNLTVAVPEPASSTLTILGTLLLAGGRSYRRLRQGGLR